MLWGVAGNWSLQSSGLALGFTVYTLFKPAMTGSLHRYADRTEDKICSILCTFPCVDVDPDASVTILFTLSISYSITHMDMKG